MYLAEKFYGSEMATNTKKTTVKGGWVARNAKSGKLVSVGSSSGTFKGKPKTIDTVKEVSSKREAALKRLADR